jgi:steroid delta-isomerase-like uncharacterized protein
MNLEFANTWARALSTDVDELVSLYADEFVVELGTYADSVGEALISPEALKRELARFSNTDPDNGDGIHVFEATTYEGHERHGIIQWSWSGEHLKTFRGVPAENRKLTTVGQTFQQYDAQGKITRETTYWADLKALKALGAV